LFEIVINKESDVSLLWLFVANGFTMSGVNVSATSDDSSVPPNFVTYPIPSSGSAAMEAGFESAAGTYMQHGSYFWFSHQSYVMYSFSFLCIHNGMEMVCIKSTVEESSTVFSLIQML